MTDPVDARLLAALAEQGKAAVHELAAVVGMDPREVAYRLVALSGSGLPLLVGVECDPHGLRAAVAGTGAWGAQNTGGPHQVQGAPSGAYQVHGAPSGAYQVHGAPSGAYNNIAGAPPVHYQQGPRSPQAPQFQQPPGYPPAHRNAQHQPPAQQPVSQQAVSQQAAQHHMPPRPAPPDPVISTWGPPQSASWARGDQLPPAASAPPATNRTGRSGDVLETHGLEGEQLALQLLEVQDPADFLFSAAGYRLDDGERAVVVHTEITNRGSTPYASLPDNYLELITAEGDAVTKAPVSLSSRPPHRIGVRPGETAGGHTVYVLPDATRIVAVRWSARPEVDEHSVTWSIDD